MKNGTFFLTSRLVNNLCLTFSGFRSFSSLTSVQAPLEIGISGNVWVCRIYRGRKLQPSDLDSGPAGLLVADGLVYGMASVSGQIWGFGIQKQVESGEKANLTFANTSNFTGLVEKRSSFIKICPEICVGNHLVPWFLINKRLPWTWLIIPPYYKSYGSREALPPFTQVEELCRNIYYVWIGVLCYPHGLFFYISSSMECNIHFAASLQDNTRVTNVQVSLHRWVPEGQHFPTKFTWSRSGKTKVANGIAEAWASKASMPGTGFSIDSWLICLRLRGVVWFWWKVKNLLFHDALTENKCYLHLQSLSVSRFVCLQRLRRSIAC